MLPVVNLCGLLLVVCLLICCGLCVNSVVIAAITHSLFARLAVFCVWFGIWLFYLV